MQRKKPLANDSPETFQPHCSGFEEVKLKRLAHARHKRSDQCVFPARTITSYSCFCTIARDLRQVFIRVELIAPARFGCSSPLQECGVDKVLEHIVERYCCTAPLQLAAVKLFLDTASRESFHGGRKRLQPSIKLCIVCIEVEGLPFEESTRCAINKLAW